MAAGSAVGDRLSSGLSSVKARSVAFSEPDDVAGAAAGAVVLGAEVAGEGCGAAEDVLACESIWRYILLPRHQSVVIMGHLLM